MTQVRIKNTREVFPVPQGSVLVVTPSRSTSAGRVTLNTSGVTPVGPWTVAGGASTTIGPFSSFVDLTVESTSGTVFAEVTSAATLTAAQGAAASFTLDPVLHLNATIDCTGTLSVTVPAGLGTTFCCTLQLPASGTVSIVSSGGVLLNGAATTLTRTIANQRLVALVSRSVANSYDVTGS